MLIDFTLVPSTSEKCVSSEVLLPDVEGPFERNESRNAEKRMTRGQCPSKCQVCRHPATGYHYDVPSCNGCKTFFRRSILDGRKYACLKMRKCMTGDAPVDLSRRMCRACRFDRCVESGMNPSAIQAEVKTSDGEELKKEIMMKRSASEVINTKHVLSNFDMQVNKIVGRLTAIEMKIEPLYTGGLPPGFKDNRKLQDIIRSPPILRVDDIPNPSFVPVPVDETTGELKVGSGCYIHTCILASLEYSKMFDFVHKIDFASQLLLLKHATIMCSDMMTAFNSFQLKSDKLVHPNGHVSGPPRERYGEIGMKIQATMQKTLLSVLRNQLTRVEYLLLKAIVLCNPAVSGLSPLVQQVIGKEREEYVRALLTFCLLNHGSVHGPSRFSALLSITSVLENQQKTAKDFHHLAKAIVTRQCGAGFKRISALFEEIMES